MIVVDAGVAAYAFMREDQDRAALADAIDRIDSDWRVPVIGQAEFNNVPASYVRFRGMSLDTAAQVLVRAMGQLPLQPVYAPPIDVVMAAAAGDCSAYDAEYVVAARRLGVKLVTGDRKLAAAFPDTAVTMEGFVGV